MRGHIRQRGKTWYYIVDVGEQKRQKCSCGYHAWVENKPSDTCPECGNELLTHLQRRQMQKGGYATRREAQATLTSLLAKMQQGSYFEPANVTLRDYLTDEWLPAIKAKVKPSTYLSYETHVHRHINPAIGNVPLQKLTPAMLDAFYGDLATQPRKTATNPRRKSAERESEEAKPLSPLTCRKVHATLHKALADAVRKERLLRNPAEAADPPKTKSAKTHEMKTWNAKELRAFLESTKETRLYSLWLTLATTGMRRGEALGLRWEDIDLDAARISIRQNRVSVGYRVHVGKPKTGRGRNISVDPGTLAVLKSLRRQQLEEKMQWQQAGYEDSGYVFRREDGTPYHPDSISQAFEKAVRDSEQPRIRLHDLRHTHATLALQAGIHPKVVSERLGHASISITLDIYSHAIPAMEEEAAAKVAALFLG